MKHCYMKDVFQNNRLKGRITALLDSRAALNVLSSKLEESLGLQKNTQGLSTSMSLPRCQQKYTKTANNKTITQPNNQPTRQLDNWTTVELDNWTTEQLDNQTTTQPDNQTTR